MGGWPTVLIFSRVITIVGCRKFRFAQRSSFEWLGAPRQGVRRTLYLSQFPFERGRRDTRSQRFLHLVQF